MHLILSIIGHKERERNSANTGYSKYSNLALATTYTSYFIFLFFNTLKKKVKYCYMLYWPSYLDTYLSV